MTFLSYAQNFEDVMLYRALRNVGYGFYIDVGAQHPIDDSVTKAFYELGWRGINVDPVPQWSGLLRKDRPHDTTLQLALGARGGHKLMFEVADTGLSTDNEAFAKHHMDAGYLAKSFEVDVSTLDEVCELHNVSIVHFLKIDVEGAEADVIKGFSFDRVRPWIVLVEAIEPVNRDDSASGQVAVPSHQDWEPILLAHRYVFAYDDGLNRFYVSEERRDLLKHFTVQPNPLDDFARYQEQIKHERIVQLDSELKLLTDASMQAARRVELENFQDKRREELSAHEDVRRDSANRLQRIIVLEQENAVLQNTALHQRADLERLVTERHADHAERDNLSRDNANRLERIMVLEQECAALNGRLSVQEPMLLALKDFPRSIELERSLADEHDRNQGLQQELDLLRGRYLQQAERSDLLDTELNAFISSHSWRLTKPLRWVRRMLASEQTASPPAIVTSSSHGSDNQAARPLPARSARGSGKIKSIAKRGALALARAAAKHPTAANVVWRAVSVFPKGKIHLVMFIKNNEMVIRGGDHGELHPDDASKGKVLSVPPDEDAEVNLVHQRLTAAIERNATNSGLSKKK